MVLIGTFYSLLFICGTSIVIGECSSCGSLDDMNHLSLLAGVWPVSSEDNSAVRYEISLCAPLSYDSSPQKENCVDSAVCAISNGTAISLGKSKQNVSIIPLKPLETLNLFLAAGPCGKKEESARSFIDFSCGETLGSPELSVYGDCMAYFTWRTSAACKTPPKRNEVPCYVIDKEGKKIDLTGLIKPSYYSVRTADPSMQFLINVCTDINDMSDKNCPANSSACRIINDKAVSVGKLKSGLQLSDEGPVLLYEAEETEGCSMKPTTKIIFRCPKRLQFRSPRLISKFSCQYEIEWETEFACPEHMLVGNVKTCQFTKIDHGVQIDLSPLKKSTGQYHVQADINGTNVDFFLNVCGGLNNMSCNGSKWQSAAVCAQYADQENSSQVIGSIGESELKYADDHLKLIYGKGKCLNGLNQATVIDFICSETEDGPKYISVDECAHFFQWKTPHACEIIPPDLTCTVQKGIKTINLGRLQKISGRAWEIIDGTEAGNNGNGASYYMNVCDSVSKLDYLNECGDGTSLCMIDKDGKHVSLGRYLSAPMYDSNIDSVVLKYTNGSACGHGTWSSSIRFICLSAHLSPILMSINKEKCLYEFEWRSAAACPLGHTEGSNCTIYDQSLGFTIDLTSLKSEVYEFETGGSKFSLGICESIPNPCSLGDTIQNASVCQIDKSRKSPALVIGNTNDKLSYVNGYVNLTYQAVISNKPGQNFSVSIIFLCDSAAGRGKPVYLKNIEQFYEFRWYTDLVCQESIGTSCIVHEPVSHNIYDLSSLSMLDKNWETTFTDKGVVKRLYINVCRLLVPGTKCDHKASACITEYNETTGETKVLNVGQIFENPRPRIDNYLQLNYSHGEPCVAYGVNTTYTTVVHFVCATHPSLDRGPQFIGWAGNCQLLFLWSTKAACPTGDIVVHNSCQLTDPTSGFNFNFASLKRETPYMVSSESRSFQLNICGPVKGGCFNDTDNLISAYNVSVCETSPNGKLTQKLGSSDLFTLQYSKEKDLTMVYEGNEKGAPSAIVRFMCMNGTSEPNLHYVKEENNHVFFEMKTALACEAEYFQCQFVDVRGNDYDLSPLASNLGSNYVVGDSRPDNSGVRYHLNFCRPLHRISLYNCPGGATAACEINIHDQTGTGFSLGTQYHPPSISEDGTISVRYTNGSDCGVGQFKRSVRINLFCSQIEGVLVFVGETPECEYIFSMNTQYACPLQSNHGSNCAVTDPVFGHRFNLSPLKNISATVIVGEYKYFISVCGHLQNITEKCKDSAVCQTKPSDQEFSKNLGLPNSNLTYNKGILALKYESGSGNCHGQYERTSVITFTCDHNATESTMPKFVTEAEDCTYIFEWPTIYACPPIHTVECSVEDDDGHIYDLSKLSLTNDNYYVKSASNITFIINVCRSVVHTPDSICPYYSAACLYDQTNPKVVDRTINIGDAKFGPYIENGQLRLKYSNGQPCKTPGSNSARFYETIIDFSCNKDIWSEELAYIGSDHCTYYFDWSTRYACPVSESKPIGNCTVEDPITGYQFNFTSLKRDVPYKVKTEDHEFSINVCGGVKNSACDSSAGICQQETSGKKNYWNAGKSNADLQLSDNVLFFNFSNGDSCHNGKYRRNTIIQFHCGVSDSPQPEFLFESTDCTYFFTWTTTLACQYAVHCGVHNGSDYFDLSPLSAAGVGIARSDVYNDDSVYFINVCGSLSNYPRIPCPPSASVCRLNLHNDTGEDLGTIAHTPFIDFKGHLTTIYNNGSQCASSPSERSRARIIYLCDPNQYLGSPVLIDIDDSLCFYLFEWRTSLVCPSKTSTILSTSCMYKDIQRGIYFDLSPLRKNGSYYRVQGNEGNASYLLNVCDNVKSANVEQCSDASVCFQDNNSVDNYGTLSTQRFTYDSKRLRLTYTNGDDCVSGEEGKRFSDIFFVCDLNAGIGQPQFHKKYPCSTVFMWETNIVCRNIQHQCILDLDGSVFDLHLLSSMTHNWNATDKNHNMYYINLCRGIMQDTDTAGCPPSAVVCMKTKDGIHMPLGMTYTMVATKKSSTELLLTYDSQSSVPCEGLNLGPDVTATTRIVLTCDPFRGSPKLISGPDDQCFFDFSWKTNLVCPEKSKELLLEEDGILFDKGMQFAMDLRNILNMTYVVSGWTITDDYAYLINLDGNFQNKSDHFEECNSAAVCQMKPGTFFHRDIGSYITRKFFVRGAELHLTLHSLTKACGKQPTRNVTTIIVMLCSTAAKTGNPEFLYETGGCDYVFYWENDAVCPRFNITQIGTNATSDKREGENSSSTPSSHHSHQTAIAMSLVALVTICLIVFILSKAERRASVASKFRLCFSRVSVPRFRYKRGDMLTELQSDF